LRSYKEYLLIYQFLRLYFRLLYEQIQVNYNAFVSPTSRPEFDVIIEKEYSFTTSPVGFLRILIILRRKRQNFQKSYFDRILYSKLLVKEQF